MWLHVPGEDRGKGVNKPEWDYNIFTVPRCLTKVQIEKEEKMNLRNKQEIIEKFGANAKDTGSAEVQIAMLTKKIAELTEHMKSNKKDFATKRGLLMMVGKRKRLLSFLKEKNLEGYRSLVKELGIRG